jgi:glutaminase
MAVTLARGGINPQTGRRVTHPSVVRRTLSVMVTCGMYDAAGDWVSAVGMPAKSGVGGGIVAVLPGQLGIGVYSPLLDDKGNSVRGVRLCRSLSEQLGLHFLTVSRDSRATLRAVYRPRDNICVYETHGDLLFSGAEQLVRTVDRERGSFDVAILDVSRVDDIDDAARALLADMAAGLRAEGKAGYLVDPDGIVIRTEPEFEQFRYGEVEDAVAAAVDWLGRGFTR